MFGPRLLHTSNIVFKKCGTHLWVLVPRLRNPGDGPAHDRWGAGEKELSLLGHINTPEMNLPGTDSHISDLNIHI